MCVEAHVEQVVAREGEAHQRAGEQADAALEVPLAKEPLVLGIDQALLDLRVDERDAAQRHHDDADQLQVHEPLFP